MGHGGEWCTQGRCVCGVPVPVLAGNVVGKAHLGGAGSDKVCKSLSHPSGRMYKGKGKM